MSISNLLINNEFDLNCKSLSTDTLNVEDVTVTNLTVTGDVEVTGDVDAHNVTAVLNLNGKSVQLSGEELSPGSEMYQAVKLEKDTPLVFDVGTDTNTWSPAISFYGEENVDRSLYFYGGSQAGNQKITDWRKECSMKINDNVVVQNGNLVLFQSPAPSTFLERTTEKTISFNYGDNGLVGGETCNIGMVGNSVNGVEGNIIFRTQSSETVPPSTLREAMRITGSKVGIFTSTPTTSLDVNGDFKATSSEISLNSAVGGELKTNQFIIGSSNMPNTTLCAKFKSPSAANNDGGQLFIEAGTDGGGDREGWSTLSWNGYLNGVGGGYVRMDETKQIWQMKTDQRTATDSFSISSLTPTNPVAPSAITWLTCDGDVLMSLNQQLVLDASPGLPVIRPFADNTIDLGYAGFRWKTIYATTGTINTSDENMKNSIVTLSEDKGLSYINQLRPVSYKWNDGGVRNHSGFIAQEVEAVMSGLGDVDGLDNGTVIKSTIQVDDPEYVAEEGHEEDPVPKVDKTVYGLRYTEMIASLVKAVQELSSKNEALVARVEALENA